MATPHAYDGNDLEALVDLEQQYACVPPGNCSYLVTHLVFRFYDVGYSDGLQHGKLHGNIEGRQLGREKGFEMWEELGFYEGFASLWKAVSEDGRGKDKYA